MKKQTKPRNHKLVLGREVVKQLTTLDQVQGGRRTLSWSDSNDNSHDCDSTQPVCGIISH